MKEALVELLRHGRHEQAAVLAAGRRGGSRRLAARLWDADPAVRTAAAAAVAQLCTLAPGQLREILRRFVWALNDESGTNAAAVLPAFAAAARRCPESVAVHLGALVALLDDAGLRPGVVAVLEAVAQTAPHLLEPHAGDVRARAELTYDLRLAALAARLEGGKGNDQTE